MSETTANVEITATSNRLNAGLAAAASKVGHWSDGVHSSMKRIGESAIGSAIGNTVSNLASRGLDVLTDQAKATLDFESNLNRLGIAGGLTTAQLDNLRTSARATSAAVGIGADQILAGTQNYVDLTGDVDGATSAMSSFARIAQASGASVSDVSSAAAAYKGVGVDLKDIEGIFGGLITQGKMGAVSMKDLAGELSSLLPQWNHFQGGNSMTGLAELGASFQIARTGFGSASEAATGLQALMGGLVSHAKTIRKELGVNVLDKKGNLKDYQTILQEITGSKKYSDANVSKAFGGNKEALATLNVLRQSLNDMGTDGKSAYQKLVDGGMDAGAVQRDLTTRLESSAGQMDVAMQKLKNSISNALTTERIEMFTGAITKAVGAISALSSATVSAGEFMGEGAAKNLKMLGNNDWFTSMMNSVSAGSGDALHSAFTSDSEDAAQRGLDRVRANPSAYQPGQAPTTLAQSTDQWAPKRTYGPEVPKRNVLLLPDQTPLKGVDGAAAAEQIANALVAALPPAIAAAVSREVARMPGQAPPNMYLGDNQVAKAATSATSARRAP